MDNINEVNKKIVESFKICSTRKFHNEAEKQHILQTLNDAYYDYIFKPVTDVAKLLLETGEIYNRFVLEAFPKDLSKVNEDWLSVIGQLNSSAYVVAKSLTQFYEQAEENEVEG